MSKCDLLISLDENKRNYTIQDTIRGTLSVMVSAPCNCKALTIELTYKTHGKGNRQKKQICKITLFSGELKSGTYSYPFEFVAPAGPLTYHGHILNVDWYIKAQADIPWVIDPITETDIILEKGEYTGRIDQGVENTLEHKYNQGNPGSSSLNNPDLINLQKMLFNKKILVGIVLIVLLPFLIRGVFQLILLFNSLSEDKLNLDYLFPVIFSLIPVLIGSIIIWKLLKRSIAENKIGEVIFLVNPVNVHAGQTTKCSLSFTPRDSISLNSIVVQLTGSETVVSGSGTNRSTYHHVLYTYKDSVREGRKVLPEYPYTKSFKLEVPSSAAPSFYEQDNKIEWECQLDIVIDGWPDWSRKQKVIILP